MTWNWLCDLYRCCWNLIRFCLECIVSFFLYHTHTPSSCKHIYKLLTQLIANTHTPKKNTSFQIHRIWSISFEFKLGFFFTPILFRCLFLLVTMNENCNQLVDQTNRKKLISLSIFFSLIYDHAHFASKSFRTALLGLLMFEWPYSKSRLLSMLFSLLLLQMTWNLRINDYQNGQNVIMPFSFVVSWTVTTLTVPNPFRVEKENVFFQCRPPQESSDQNRTIRAFLSRILYEITNDTNGIHE